MIDMRRAGYPLKRGWMARLIAARGRGNDCTCAEYDSRAFLPVFLLALPRPRPMIPCETIAQHPDFRHLASVSAVLFDLRYASTNNFSGQVLYSGFDCAYLRREAADGLALAAQWLATQRPAWRLLVLDALRPQRVQEAIWKDAKGTPIEMYFANPEPGSIHSYGMAVDVTLVDAQGAELDMGTAFDAMELASHPELHAEHLALGVLTAAHIERRGWLYAAMTRGGFVGIDTEWWHFDFGPRKLLRERCPKVY
jgi:zinc D-Ala-D-Ala dipeptidase